MQHRAAALGQGIKAEKGIENALQVIESLLRSRRMS
jgi:hypothetical protein